MESVGHPDMSRIKEAIETILLWHSTDGDESKYFHFQIILIDHMSGFIKNFYLFQFQKHNMDVSIVLQ